MPHSIAPPTANSPRNTRSATLIRRQPKPGATLNTMVFVLDNYDSFTFNLVQYMGELGADVVVRRNDELTPAEVEALHPDRIVSRPAPARRRKPASPSTSSATSAGKVVPILGVCLGHQAIGAAFGGNVIRAPKLMHGKTSDVQHDGKTIFDGISTPMTCTRYHSLIVEEKGLPEDLEVSARTGATAPSWACATAASPSKACSSTPRPSSPPTASGSSRTS